MHSFDFVSKFGFIALYGGRNDFLNENQIFSDLWILKLHNLNWTLVNLEEQAQQIPRFNHASLVIES
jgi:hypothetical protein